MAKRLNTPPCGAANDESAKVPSADRRRWLKAWLSTTPVLMTVASRPVLAQTCVPPSAYVSLGASAPGMSANCSGYGPETWLNGTGVWPNTYEPNQPFKKYFTNDLAGNPKLADVLGTSPIEDVLPEYHAVARYVTAALLNNASGKVPESVLRAMTIQHIWTEFATKGSFAPTSGASWSAAEIVEYLKSTMISA
jgi:hypothetical protein